MIVRARFFVRGIVQGVGFRPFLHRMAQMHALVGFARNTGHGVEGEIEGEEAAVAAFCAALEDPRELPPLAVVTQVDVQGIECLLAETAFVIKTSAADGIETLVSPDIGTCADCLREMRDPADRRYRYPFINCTNCGPRFTILKTVPYDRARTTMAAFPMCGDCQREYGDIADRRYHAQPDCCPVCGPQLWFADEMGHQVPGDAIAHALTLLRAGGVLAVKGLGGFHLACMIDAQSVSRLRARKHREEKPLAVLCRDVQTAKTLCYVSEAEAAQLDSPRKPIVLLKKRQISDFPWLSDNASIGVMLPYTPIHALLCDGLEAMVLTSANVSELPATIDNDEAIAHLSGIADGFLLHDRLIESRCDDSLLRVVDGEPYFYRRSRGYAPQPIALHLDCTGILALGAEQKASFALGKGQDAFYSQHIGDLKNAQTLTHYETQIARFMSLFGQDAGQLVCDLHPDYLSTRYAAEQHLPVLRVQHHHAHMAACMADNALRGEVIGVIWDGTGLGEDSTIWGGEFLTGGYAGALRAASILPIPLPGGDAAIHRIGRIGVSLCHSAGLEAGDPLVVKLLQKGINCPLSSGMGRLFDGVYALLTGRESVSYEGQGAVLLETLAVCAPEETGAFPIDLIEEDGLLRFDWRAMIRSLRAAQEAGEAAPRLAMRFHNTLVEMAVAVCLRIRSHTGLSRVVLSGGVFFNEILLHALTRALEAEGFAVYRHRRVSTGDEGIALGQLAIAASKKQTTSRAHSDKPRPLEREFRDVPCSSTETDLRLRRGGRGRI